MQHNIQRYFRFITTVLLMAMSLSVGACATSSIDQAYYSNGVGDSFSSGYTRTIFSSSNF